MTYFRVTIYCLTQEIYNASKAEFNEDLRKCFLIDNPYKVIQKFPGMTSNFIRPLIVVLKYTGKYENRECARKLLIDRLAEIYYVYSVDYM